VLHEFYFTFLFVFRTTASSEPGSPHSQAF